MEMIREEKLEKVMMEFIEGEYDILLSTTIIESGLDIANANTIIINRADKFGLSQLHQIRGRVGRSNRQAYCYLLVQDKDYITENAKKRLLALENMEDLGSGFSIASRDLEIRGAGALLGESQSGEIQEIGFSLYNRILTKAISSLKSGEIPNFDVVINATSLGLNQDDKINLDFTKVGKNKLFYDVIYNPSETNFLNVGKKSGNKFENGKLMFVYQAFSAFKLWHSVEPVSYTHLTLPTKRIV